VPSWADLAAAAPELAEKGRALLYRTGSGEALLATVRDDEPPRIHPIAIQVMDGGLFAFILPSPKLTDLLTDGRYALHAYPDAVRPHEFVVRGRVVEVDGDRRRSLAEGWSWTVGEARCFELLVEEAVIGERETRDDWPPRYSVWPARG
jgi:hypothetical protein